LMKETFNPLNSRRAPMEEDANPFPKEETTPPVIKIYFVLALANGSSIFTQQEKPGIKNLSINSNPFSIKVPLLTAETSSNASIPTLFAFPSLV